MNTLFYDLAADNICENAIQVLNLRLWLGGQILRSSLNINSHVKCDAFTVNKLIRFSRTAVLINSES
jgi:hypothetical protein